MSKIVGHICLNTFIMAQESLKKNTARQEGRKYVPQKSENVL